MLQISDIPLIIFGDSQITSIFAQKRLSFNFRQNIATYYVLQISVIPSLILVTVTDHFDFRKRVRFTCIFENDGEKSCKNWLENEFCVLPPEE